MPRNVRNFYLEATIDGGKTPLATGPRAKDGGFTLRIYQRDKGGIVKALTIEGRALTDGTLRLSAVNTHGDELRSTTVR